MTQFPIIYLPIEFQSREFDSKALLAATLTERGYAVVLGQQWLIYENIPRLPPGVILFKSFNKIHQSAMALARQSGHRVVILDEEMLAQTEVKSVEAIVHRRHFSMAGSHPRAMASSSMTSSGVFQTGKNRIEITGNGRIDLLKPALRPLFQRAIDEIVARHGDFVLVNTNFTIANSIWQGADQVNEDPDDKPASSSRMTRLRCRRGRTTSISRKQTARHAHGDPRASTPPAATADHRPPTPRRRVATVGWIVRRVSKCEGHP